MTDAPKVHEENKAKSEADHKLKAEKAELDAFFRVDKGTEEVKDKDGKVVTPKTEGDTKDVVTLKEAYRDIALTIVEQLPESRERFFALDTLSQSFTWAAEAVQKV